MVGYLRVHGIDDGNVVDVLSGAGKQITDLNARFAIRTKLERRRKSGSCLAFRCQRFT